jgi:hypothetical protein
LPLILKSLDMREEVFWRTVDTLRDPRILQRGATDDRQLADSVTAHVGDVGAGRVRLDACGVYDFKLPPAKTHVLDDHCVLVGCGWVEGWKMPARVGS